MKSTHYHLRRYPATNTVLLLIIGGVIYALLNPIAFGDDHWFCLGLGLIALGVCLTLEAK